MRGASAPPDEGTLRVTKAVRLLLVLAKGCLKNDSVPPAVTLIGSGESRAWLSPAGVLQAGMASGLRSG